MTLAENITKSDDDDAKEMKNKVNKHEVKGIEKSAHAMNIPKRLQAL